MEIHSVAHSMVLRRTPRESGLSAIETKSRPMEIDRATSIRPTPSPTRSVSEMRTPVRRPATHCTFALCRRRQAWSASSATRF